MKQKEILDALRGGAQVSHTDDMGLWIDQEVCTAAADEIERLRDTLKKLQGEHEDLIMRHRRD